MNIEAPASSSTIRHGKLAALALLAITSLLPSQTNQGPGTPELPPGCEALRVPAGNVASLHVYAEGVQTYEWNAAASQWVFTGPLAVLFADAERNWPIGVHYTGPTWVCGGGSVVGSLVVGCPVDPTAVPWLLLRSVTTEGRGPLARTTFIQRVNTTGGRAPTRLGTANEVVWVPYTAEYYFYRAQ